MYYRINTPRVVHETIDDETILIDFDSGTYYSVRDVANQLWVLLAEAYSVEQIVALAQAQYIGAREEIETAVRRFIASLAEEALIVEAPPIASTPTPPVAGPAAPFTTPILERYTDMQDLLLLDPIHEVDEQGWPMRKQ